MLSAIELKSLSIKPRINDISLKILSEYYEMFLYPFIYHYHIKSVKEERVIELRFNLENFCHLLGIEYSVPMKELHNYRGKAGWDNISNLVIDFQLLKSLNKNKFKNIKAKYVYFYLLMDLVENPIAVNYDVQNVNPITNIDCEILFYSKVKMIMPLFILE